MSGWTWQVCRCLWQMCRCWTRRKPCTWGRWTLPCPSESCPAARSSLWGTCPLHLPLGNVLPARIYFIFILTKSKIVGNDTALIPALARPRRSLNEVELFRAKESNKSRGLSGCNCNHLHKKELLGEKSDRPQIWSRPKFLQSLLVSHLSFKKF